METPSLQELKEEMLELEPRQLVEICLKLAKHKNENKEFLSYLLFNAQYKEGFVELIKAEMDTLFSEIMKDKHPYYAKKGLRRIQRIINKYCRYMDNPIHTIEVHLYFCRKIKETQIPVNRDGRLQYLQSMEYLKVTKLIAKLHEDLQADYTREMQQIMAMK